MGWVDAINDVGTGNLDKRVNFAVAAGNPNVNEYNCDCLSTVGLSPSAGSVGIVPSGLMFIRVSRSSVAGSPETP